MEALNELSAFSLVSHNVDKLEFTVHRLVQDVSRMAQNNENTEKNITACLRWLNEGFVGEPQDVRDWPVLEPLVPHLTELLAHSDRRHSDNAIESRLLNQLGLLYLSKAQHKLAEPLMRRALKIDEQYFGENHPNVARGLNNLAQLLQDTNRLAEAEPLMRRAFIIFLTSLGFDHPNTQMVLNNYISLLLKMGQTNEEIKETLSNLLR